MGFGGRNLASGPADNLFALVWVGPTTVVAQKKRCSSLAERRRFFCDPGHGPSKLPYRDQALFTGEVLGTVYEIIDKPVVQAVKVDGLPICQDSGVHTARYGSWTSSRSLRSFPPAGGP